MFQEGTDATLDDQVSRPKPTPAPAPSFNLGSFAASPFRGIGGGVAKSIAFGSEILGAFGQVQGAYGGDSAGGMFSTQTAQERQQADTARERIKTEGIDYSNEGGDTFRQRAADIMPDPQTAHTSEQVVAGLTDYATRAIGYSFTLGPLAPVFFGGDVGMEESDRLKQQGVDLATRTKAGATAGVINAVAMVAPLKGATAVTRFVKGAAGGEGAIVGQALAERAILRAAGYDKLADTFDPLDPVGLAMGLVPGVIGAKFGRPVKTEAQMRDAARLTPAEQARSDAYERSPENIAALQEAIKAEKRPEIRAELEAELVKRQREQAEHGVARAVEAEPDLVPAARVGQVVDALEASRLTPDTDLAGRTEHISAVEMAADQIGRGDPVEVRPVLQAIDEPPAEGAVRLYAAGEALDKPVKLSTDLAATQEAARAAGTGVHFMDLPADHPALVRPTAPEAGLVPHATMELSPEMAGQLLQRLRADIPHETAAAVDQLQAVRSPPEPAASRAASEPAPPKQTEKAAKAGKPTKQEPPAKAPSAAQEPRSGGAEAETSPSVERAAADIEALDPEMPVQLEGMDAPMKVGELMAMVREEARQDTLMGKLLEVAAACDLRN